MHFSSFFLPRFQATRSAVYCIAVPFFWQNYVVHWKHAVPISHICLENILLKSIHDGCSSLSVLFKIRLVIFLQSMFCSTVICCTVMFVCFAVFQTVSIQMHLSRVFLVKNNTNHVFHVFYFLLSPINTHEKYRTVNSTRSADHGTNRFQCKKFIYSYQKKFLKHTAWIFNDFY